MDDPLGFGLLVRVLGQDRAVGDRLLGGLEVESAVLGQLRRGGKEKKYISIHLVTFTPLWFSPPYPPSLHCSYNGVETLRSERGSLPPLFVVVLVMSPLSGLILC